ncbi:MAG: threonine synthase [Inhella sp.]|uniref:threonine synthase n=1 Tax=Inhella sp. TaxID=1921806 RepID=UPI00391F8A7D
MKYVSTRGGGLQKRFCDILLEGLADDGGLYLPTHYPQVDAATLARWRTLSYAELAFEILSLYIDDIPAEDLRRLTAQTYRAEVFGGRPEITPLHTLEPGLHVQELSNGPTLAFKDMAMQLLGALFEYELGRRGEALNILGATSGDTGSAAEYAMRGRAGVRVFMLSPHGRMSAFQQAQMFSLQDANIHNLAVRGVFDDCQDIVKAVSNDLAFKKSRRIGTVNSINWARLLAQVVYYFAGYFQATKDAPGLRSASPPPEGATPAWGGPAPAANDLPRVSFTVPSGNFGNVCAGHVARQMGLPIAQLVVATNENDVLDEFFRTGRYAPRGAAQTHATSSPSMDISKASNFERFIADLFGRDGARVHSAFTSPSFELSAAEKAEVEGRYAFASGRSSHADRLTTIRTCQQRYGRLIDPHTADGLKVALERRQAGVPMIVLETALPAKFAETLREATGQEPPRLAGLEGIEALPKRVTVIDNDVQAVRTFIDAHVDPR